MNNVKHLQTLTKCIEKCEMKHQIKILSDASVHDVYVKCYKKADFKNIDFDKQAFLYIQAECVKAMKNNYPLKSAMFRSKKIYNDEKNNSLLINRISEFSSKIDPNSVIFINLDIYNMLNYSKKSIREMNLIDNLITPTNLVISGLNVYVVQDKFIQNNIVIYAKTKQNHSGMYSFINMNKSLFTLRTIGEFNNGYSFKYIY